MIVCSKGLSHMIMSGLQCGTTSTLIASLLPFNHTSSGSHCVLSTLNITSECPGILLNDTPHDHNFDYI